MMVANQYKVDFLLINELKTRMKLGLFMILVWQLSLVVYPPKMTAALMMIIATLIDLVSIAIIYKIAGNRSLARDINEINLYSIALHLIAIPAYYFTTIPVEYHNNGIWILFGLTIARLFYFGEKTAEGYKGLPAFGILGYCQKKVSEIKKIPFKYLSDILFFVSAIPLWFIIYKTKDQSITITIIGLMLFIYLISDVIKTQAAIANTINNEAELKSDEALLLQIFNSKSVAEKADILRFAANSFTTTPDEAAISAPITNKKRELVHSLMDSYYETHPQARNILVAVNWYFANAFPRNRDYDSLTLTERRQDWVAQVRELMILGEEISKNKDAFTWDDFTRFQVLFEGIFSSDGNALERIRNHLEFVDRVGGMDATDTDIILAADLLIMAWFKLILRVDDEYFEMYEELNAASVKFVKDNLTGMPIELY